MLVLHYLKCMQALSKSDWLTTSVEFSEHHHVVERDERDEDEEVDGCHRRAGQEREVVVQKALGCVVASRPGQGIGVL